MIISEFSTQELNSLPKKDWEVVLSSLRNEQDKSYSKCLKELKDFDVYVDQLLAGLVESNISKDKIMEISAIAEHCNILIQLLAPGC